MPLSLFHFTATTPLGQGPPLTLLNVTGQKLSRILIYNHPVLFKTTNPCFPEVCQQPGCGMCAWLPPGSSAARARSAMLRLGKGAGAARWRGEQPAARSAHKAGAPWKLPQNKGATGRVGAASRATTCQQCPKYSSVPAAFTSQSCSPHHAALNWGCPGSAAGSGIRFLTSERKLGIVTGRFRRGLSFPSPR